MKFISLPWVLVAIFFSATANANVTVEPMSSTISAADDGVGQLRISSKSKAVQYLKLTVKRVEAPATPQERDVETNPTDGTGLIASPQRIVLPAGARRVVRLALLETPKVETLYRVFVEPVAAPEEKDEAAAAEREGRVAPKVSVTLVWGALVRAEPETPMSSIDLDAARTKIVNAGNVRVRIVSVGQCDRASDPDCRWHDIDKNVYPDQSMDISNKSLGQQFIGVRYRLEGGEVQEKFWQK